MGLFAIQAVVVVVWGLWFTYGEDAAPGGDVRTSPTPRNYGMFIDVQVMIFFGIGYLMSFLSRYAWSSVGVAFMMGAVAFQVATITNAAGAVLSGREPGGPHGVSLTDFLLADFTTATVLISYGAVVGRTSPVQLLVMIVVECVMVAVNDSIDRALSLADMGGGVGVHIFGAYFGLALSVGLGPKPKDGNGVEPQMSHTNDIFTMVGTILLWANWPSFNAALAPEGPTQHRIMLNTAVSLLASAAVAFGFSRVMRGRRRFDMEDVQNATLAGGVAVACVCDFPIGFWGASLVGAAAAIVSVTGYSTVAAKLRALGVHDTAGIHNLHAMPGMLAGVTSIVACLASSKAQWGGEAPPFLPAGRTLAQQAGIQALAMLIAVVLAVVSGSLTGLLLRHPFFEPVGAPDRPFFEDEGLWHMESLDLRRPDVPLDAASTTARGESRRQLTPHHDLYANHHERLDLEPSSSSGATREVELA